MNKTVSYVQTDAAGVMRVGQQQVPLDSVLAAFEQGHSPESIRSQYPSLTLEEIYGAITYYLAHQDEVHEYLRRQDSLWAQWKQRSEQAPNPLLTRLRNARRVTAGQQP